MQNRNQQCEKVYFYFYSVRSAIWMFSRFSFFFVREKGTSIQFIYKYIHIQHMQNQQRKYT